MGGAVSSGRDNNELIDNLMGGNYIRTRVVERVFRALDRAEYMSPEARDQAYKDLAWRNGPLHLSAPCIYSEVMEGLELKPGLTFLNVGSGTGYLSTLVGLILGSSGVSHGVEVHPVVVDYATKKLGQFLENSPSLDEFDFCEPRFYCGNGLCLAPQLTPYDRVYCGAGCPEEYQNYFKQLIKVGGVLVMPLHDNLLQVRRLSADEWSTRSLLNVSFATLRVPSKEEAAETLRLEEQAPARLQLLARAAVRGAMRAGLRRRHPELREPPHRAPPAKKVCPRRICIPIDDESDTEGLNALHDLDRGSGANEMNALLSLVLSMGHNRVAGALRVDPLDSPTSSDDSSSSDDDTPGDRPDSDSAPLSESVRESQMGLESDSDLSPSMPNIIMYEFCGDPDRADPDTDPVSTAEPASDAEEPSSKDNTEASDSKNLSRAESSRADSSRADSGKADSSKSASSRANSGRTDSSKTESSRADSGRGDSSRLDSSKAESKDTETKPRGSKDNEPKRRDSKGSKKRSSKKCESKDDDTNDPNRPESPCLPSEVEIYLGKTSDMPSTSSMEWEREETKREHSSDEETTESTSKVRDEKRQKFDSGIGEENTPSSSSSPDKTCKSDDSDVDESRRSDSLPEDAADEEVKTRRRRQKRRLADVNRRSSSSEGEGEGEGGEGARPAAPEEEPGTRRLKRRAATSEDARRVRLSILMKRGVKELPLPHALKKYVNLGRCFEF